MGGVDLESKSSARRLFGVLDLVFSGVVDLLDLDLVYYLLNHKKEGKKHFI